MSSQVSGAGSGSRPVVVQSQEAVNETKSSDLQKTPENASQPSAPRSASPQEKSQKQLEKSMEGSMRKNLLHEEIHAKEANTTSSKKTKGKEADQTWMTELAKTLGELENKQAQKVKEKVSRPAQPVTTQTMADAQAEAQKLGTLQQSTAQVIKSVGDAVSTAARKQ